MIDYEVLLLGAIAIVGLSDWLKAFDKEKKFQKFYNLIPMIIAIPVAIVVTAYTKSVWYMAFLYGAVEVAISVLAYQNIIETIQKISKK